MLILLNINLKKLNKMKIVYFLIIFIAVNSCNKKSEKHIDKSPKDIFLSRTDSINIYNEIAKDKRIMFSKSFLDSIKSKDRKFYNLIIEEANKRYYDELFE